MNILGPILFLVCFTMVVFSWPERWLAWFILLMLLLFGYLTYKHTRMARRALKLVKHGKPDCCGLEIRIESGDSRDFIHGEVSRLGEKKKWDVLFTPPGWKVDPHVNKALEAEAYFESGTDCPLVVLKEYEYLWAEREPERLTA
jgi:hypothetical protein